MLPKEHLHLKHVLQTVCALEAVVHSSFGPEGGQVLFTRDTAEAMLSRNGTRILTALRLEHPVARMVVECVWKHSTATGDGSKTFIILLASLLRMIHTTACKEPNLSRTYNSRDAAVAATARRLADELLAFALDKLDDLINKGVVPYGYRFKWEDFSAKTHPSNCFVDKLLETFFHTRLGYSHCDFISNLTCELLTNWKFKNDVSSLSLQFLNDKFPALHTSTSGFPVSCSRLVEGQVIHRDFATPCPQADNHPLKAVVVTGYLQSQILNAEDVLQLGFGQQIMEENLHTGRSLVQFSAWAERSLESIIANLQSLGVSVLLSAKKQSAAALALATQASICVVECISEDELSLFSWLSGATPISDCCSIKKEHVVTLNFCKPIILGAQRCVHVAFSDLEERSMLKPCSLVICGSGEGQTDQYACAVRDAIRMLLATFKPTNITAITASKNTFSSYPHQSSFSCLSSSQQHAVGLGCVLPAGGTFEFLLHYALLKHSIGDNMPMGIPIVSQLLANALVSVPQKIYSYNGHHFLSTQIRVLSFIKNNSHPFPSLVYDQKQNTCSALDCASSDPLEEAKGNVHCYEHISSKDVLAHSGLESVSCKYQLLLAVLQCVTSLLRIDSVLYTHTALHRQPDTIADIL